MVNLQDFILLAIRFRLTLTGLLGVEVDANTVHIPFSNVWLAQVMVSWPITADHVFREAGLKETGAKTKSK